MMSNDMFQAESIFTVSVPDICNHLCGPTSNTPHARERSEIESTRREHSDWSV